MDSVPTPLMEPIDAHCVMKAPKFLVVVAHGVPAARIQFGDVLVVLISHEPIGLIILNVALLGPTSFLVGP